MSDQHDPYAPAGETVPAEPDAGSQGGSSGGGGGRRGALVAVAVVAVVLVAGAALVVGRLLGGGGTQPAAVLPGDSLAYVGIDLDPPASQKIAAYQFLRAFPALREETPEDDEDPRRALVQGILDEGGCSQVSWADDVEPWLGQRAAVALRPGAGSVEPAPVLVLQVTDEAAAREGVAALASCSQELEASGVAFSDGYVVVASSQQVADATVTATSTGTLEDDAEFAELTAAAGQDGIVEGWISPRLADELDSYLGAEGLDLSDELSRADTAAAFTLRFAGGGLEVVGASRAPEGATPTGGEQLASLPADSFIAVAGGVPEGLEDAVERLAEGVDQAVFPAAGAGGGPAGGPGVQQMLEAETGLRLPEDLRALLGDRAALAVGNGLVTELLSETYVQGPVRLPVGVVTDSEEAEVQRVVDTVSDLLPAPVDVTSGEQGTAYALDPAWAEALATGSGDTLGRTSGFADVVGDLDGSSFAMYVDLDGSWVDQARAQLPRRDARDLDDVVGPLSGIGAVTRVEGGLRTLRLRVGTD